MRDHLWVERVIGLYAAAFAGPPMLGARPSPDRGETVLGYRRDQRRAGGWLSRRPLSSARLAQRARAKALLELFLINTDSTCDPDYTVGWDLALPDPEVNRIRGYGIYQRFHLPLRISESSTRPRVLIKSRRSRQIQRFEFALVRFSSRQFALFSGG